MHGIDAAARDVEGSEMARNALRAAAELSERIAVYVCCSCLDADLTSTLQMTSEEQ